MQPDANEDCVTFNTKSHVTKVVFLLFLDTFYVSYNCYNSLEEIKDMLKAISEMVLN